MPDTPRAANITTASPVAWSNGQPFDGFLLLGLALPNYSGTQVSAVFLEGTQFPTRIPQWTKIPIISGVLDSNTKAFFNADLDPPNTQYAAFWYDASGRQIAANAAMFTITGTPHVITPPALTVPTAAVTAPTPES